MTDPLIAENTKNKSQSMPRFNPFPGLRPFGIEESHLFFGREGQSEEVLKYLSKNRFVAVIGASGSGKSSLMYCGVVPILYGGFIASAGSKWSVVATRPGNDPINNLANALVESEGENVLSKEDDFINKNIVSTVLRTSSLGLIEAVKLLNKEEDNNILLLVDQFEELFRFKQSRKGTETANDSEAFVKLLVEAVSQTNVPIYIILTMRSDFIGDCSQFQDLTELINISNYLIPQMTRDNFREAIAGPVAVGGGAIDQNLVQEILNDIGDNPDQLPIIQHALMRTWERWVSNGQKGKPISIADYEAVGKMEKALSEHANEAFEELSPKGKEICAVLFKTLTERGADNRGIRRPTPIYEIAEIAQVKPEDVYEVVETFRKTGRSFLAPSPEIPLSNDLVVDISHESLMRIWDKLKTWVEEEANSVQMYKRLAEAAELYQTGKTTLWRPPDLHLAVSWRNKQKPTLAWGKRYNRAFERTIVFLETSEKDFKAEEQNKIKLQKRALKRTRTFAIVVGSAAIISLGLTIFAFMQTNEAKKQRAEAEHQTKLAEQERVKADKQREIAVEQEKKAVDQQKIAVEERERAVEQETIAKQQERKAVVQQQIAEQEREEADKQKEKAEQQTQIAEEQRKKAEDATFEANKLRMLSIAQSMAVKSQQIQDDPELKALLAYQAYIFNQRHGGSKHNADIYKGLYEAIKTMSVANYNVYQNHSDAIRDLVFNPNNNQFYSAGAEGLVNKWDISDPTKTPTQIYKNNIPNRAISISPDGQFLAVAPGTKDIQVFDLSNDNPDPDPEPILLQGHDKSISNIRFFHKANRLISTAADSLVLLWDVGASGISQIAKIKGRAKSMDITQNDELLGIGTDNGYLIIYNIKTDSIVKEVFAQQNNSILACAFNQKNNLLAFGDKNGVIRIYDFETGNIETNFKAHNNKINDLKFNPDSRLLASAGLDGTIKLWETSDYNLPPFVFSDHEAMVFSIDFNRDGNYLISGAFDSKIIVWPTSSESIADNLKGLIARNFTEEEWFTYVAKDIFYEKTIEALK